MNTAQEKTICVYDSQGKPIIIKLKPSGGGYVGPQGESYPAMPSLNQLMERYSK